MDLPKHAALVAALALPLVACGAGETSTDSSPSDSSVGSPPTSVATTSEPTTTEDSMQTRRPSPIPVPGGGSALPTGPVPESVVQRPEVQAAIVDLAERQSVDVAEVSVAGWARVTWRDGSLGCPQPGRMYTQALVPGEQLVLSLAGRLFSYHAAAGKAFGYCASPVLPAQGGSPDS